jgi:hypothetical protein
LHPYVEAGCSVFNIIPCASDDDRAIAAVGEVRALLAASASTVGTRSRPRSNPTISKRTEFADVVELVDNS